MQKHNNTDFLKMQEEQVSKELDCKFSRHKKDSAILSDSYSRLGYDSRSIRVSECGSFLEFALFPEQDTKAKLHNANFCKDRLCPMCSWRRTLKVFGQVSQVMDVIGDDYLFVFLTLTVRNCAASELQEAVSILQKGFSTLSKYKAFKTAFKGFFKALEVTRHSEYDDRSIEYHPHLHVILAVNKGYFGSRYYLSQSAVTELWKKALGVDYTPVVDIRRVRDKKGNSSGDMDLSAAVAESAKYTVKSNDYLFVSDEQRLDEGVYTLLISLFHRRLCSFGGCFDEARKKLGLDDVVDGDLVQVDGCQLRDDVKYILVRYRWQIGLGYVLDSRYFNVDVSFD